MTQAHPHARRKRLSRTAGVAKDIFVAMALWLLWQLPIYAFLNLPPRLAIVWLLAVAAFFLWCYAVPSGWGTPRGRAGSRVRPVPREAWPWLALLAPVMATAALAMWMILTSLRLIEDKALPERILEYGKQPGGMAVLLLLIVGMAPLIEEFAFRGWLQRPLERRLGPARAIAATAFLFALAHFEPGGIPIRLAGGVALGYAAWATGSIWSSVILHVSWNAGVLLFGGVFPDFDPSTRGPLLAVPAGLAFVTCVAVYVLAARRLRLARRARSTRRETPAR